MAPKSVASGPTTTPVGQSATTEDIEKVASFMRGRKHEILYLSSAMDAARFVALYDHADTVHTAEAALLAAKKIFDSFCNSVMAFARDSEALAKKES